MLPPPYGGVGVRQQMALGDQEGLSEPRCLEGAEATSGLTAHGP